MARVWATIPTMAWSKHEEGLFNEAIRDLRELLGYYQAAKEQVTWKPPPRADYAVEQFLNSERGRLQAAADRVQGAGTQSVESSV